MGIKSYTGGHFSNTSIRAILRQEKYTGNSLLQKTYIEDHLNGKTKLNKGELPMYYAEGTHPVIIEKEIFDKVQTEVARRRKLGVFANKSIKTNHFTSKVQCAGCGMNYRRSGKRQRKNSDEIYYIRICRTKSEKGISHCHAKDVPEKILERYCALVLGLEEFDKDIFLEEIEKVVVKGQDELIYHFYDGQIITEKWESTARVDAWSKERRKAWSELKKGNKNAVGHKGRWIKDGLIAKFDPLLWNSLVDYLTVFEEGKVQITFRNGTDILL